LPTQVSSIATSGIARFAIVRQQSFPTLSIFETDPERDMVMNRPYVKTQRLVTLFILGTLLFNYPLLALFNRPVLIGAFPLLIVYVFSAWALLIGLLILIMENK
jgi:hypothetical protein